MSFVDVILARAEEAEDKPVLYEVSGAQLEPCCGFELRRSVAQARAFLRREGVVQGDRVALLAPNSIRWVAVDLAIVAEGAISVPLYARQDPKQLAGMLRDCDPKLLVASDDKLADAIAGAWPEHGAIARYVEVFSTDEEVAGPAVHHEGPVTLIYTSGTSGEPKGAMLSEPNIAYMLGVTVSELGKMSVEAREQDRVFHYLPFCFAGSRIMLFSQLFRGNPLMVSTDLTNLPQEMATAAAHYYLNVPALLERIKNGVNDRVAHMGGVVAHVYERAVAAERAQREGRAGLLDALAFGVGRRVIFPRIKKLIGENLEFLACGSAPLSEDTQRWFELIGIPVYQVYGLTETTAIVTIDDTENVAPGRVGHAIPGCELRVTQEGELLCRGPNVFMGYWNRPDATAKVLRDGWFHTGDQVELDETGNLRVVGRVKDVLVPESGHNVAPAPIEERLLSASSSLEHALVVGHGRPFLTAIVTGELSDGELERVRESVNSQLPHYMRLRKLVRAPELFTVENGLLTANQKLKRRAIEQRHRDAIERMYQ